MENEQPATGTQDIDMSAIDAQKDQLSADELFGTLAHPTNRFILYYLIKAERPVSTNELIEYATSLGESDDSFTTGEFRGGARATIVRHIPELASTGLLHCNDTESVVAPTQKTCIVEPYLSLALEHTA